MAHGEVTPPVEPMLAKAAATLPDGDGWCYEPKWDGFRAIAFRDGGTVYLQSRDLKPLDRYFPEVHDALVRGLPDGAVVDGEVVIATPHGLDFDALQMRLHPAASRVEKLSRETPASFVAFDVLAADHQDLRSHPLAARRARLEALAPGFTPSLHLTPLTRDRALAEDWLARFEGAGLDGVVAKHADAIYAAWPAHDGQDQARRAPPIASSPASAGTRRALARSSAPCCSACTTMAACCSTWA